MSIALVRLLLLAVVFQLGAAAEQLKPEEAPSSRILTISSIRNLSVPPFPYYQHPLTDGDHNLYFHYNTGRFDEPVLLKISQRDSAPVMFKLPPEESQVFLYGAASITVSGEVWMVCSKEEKETYLFSFSSDGKPGTPTKLQLSDGFLANTLAAFQSGRFFVSGYFGLGAEKPLQGKAFAGIFDDAGRLVRELNGIAEKTDLTAKVVRVPDSAVVIGTDGSAYFLNSKQVTVVRPSGEIAATIPFDKPEGARPTRLFVSHADLMIQITTVGADRLHRNKYLLIDRTTGKPVALYEPSPELGNNAVSYSRNEGLVFLKRDGTRLALLTAELK